MNDFTPEIREALFEMFASAGWRYFVNDVEKNLEGVNTLNGIQGEQALGARQGQVFVLNSIINYEDTLRQVAEQHDAEDVVETVEAVDTADITI